MSFNKNIIRTVVLCLKWKKVLLIAPFFFLTQGFFCSETESVRVPNVTVTSLRLNIYDTLNMEPGIQINWEFEPGGENQLSYFNLYSFFHPDSHPMLVLPEIPAELRTVKIKLPDTLIDRIYYGLQAVYAASTGQKWKSDSISYAALGFSDKVSELYPGRDSETSRIKTHFSVKTVNSGGEQYRMYVLLDAKDNIFNFVDTTFPFLGNGRDYYRDEVLRDSIQFKVLRDTMLIKWCILATQSPSDDPVSLTQSINCSQFYKLRPQ